MYNKRIIIVIFTTLLLGVIGFSFAVIKRPIPLYSASSSIKIEQTARLAGHYGDALSWNEADTLETHSAIIKSFPVIEMVAKALGFLDKNLTSEEIRKKSEYCNIVLSIKDRIKIEREGRSNIINIIATSENPELAQHLANTITKIYMDKNIEERNKRIDDARIFIEQQLKIARKKLKEAEEKVKAFKEKNNLISIDKEADFASLSEKELTLSGLEHQVEISDRIFSLLKAKFPEILIKEAEKTEKVKIVRPATKPATPINPPNIGTASLLGGAIGFVLGFILIFVFESLDTSIKTIDDVENFLEIPVVGIIPHVGFNRIREIMLEKYPNRRDKDILRRSARLVTHFIPRSTLAETYRTLRTNVQFICLEKGVKTILAASSSPLEGKTSTVVNLAMAMAQTGQRTLLIESDLREPVISEIFGIDREPGLTDVVLGNYEWQDTIRTIADIMTGRMGIDDIMLTPGIDNLNIITCGSIPPNPSEIVGSQRMTDLISHVRESYDVVLFDSPPALTATDASILGSKLDGVIMIYHVGKISRRALRRAKIQLENVNAKVFGVVLNGLRAGMSPDYEEFGYNRYYAYGEEGQAPSHVRRWLPLSDFFKRVCKRMEKIIMRENNGKGGLYKIGIPLLALFLIIGGLIWQITRQGPEPQVLQIKSEDVKSIIRKRIEIPPGHGDTKEPELAGNEEVIEKTELPREKELAVSNELMEDTKEPELVGNEREKELTVSHEPIKSPIFSDIIGKYPYTIQVSAHRQRDQALNEVNYLRTKGLKAFTSPVYLGDKGKWHRVEIGAFKSKEKAEDFSVELKSSFGFSWVMVYKRAFTIEIGSFSTDEDIKTKEVELITKGYSPYIFAYDSDDKHRKKRLLLGAFYTRQQALNASEQLKEDGIEHRISER